MDGSVGCGCVTYFYVCMWGEMGKLFTKLLVYTCKGMGIVGGRICTVRYSYSYCTVLVCTVTIVLRLGFSFFFFLLCFFFFYLERIVGPRGGLSCVLLLRAWVDGCMDGWGWWMNGEADG